jgi:hypothetical protein
MAHRKQVNSQTSAPDGESGRSWGAYGFRITGLERSDAHLTRVPADWPELRIERRCAATADPEAPGTLRGGDDWAELWIRDGGRVRLTRDPLSVTFTTRTPLSVDAIIHPYLGLPATIAAHWLGRHALHAGAFVRDGRAWVLLGDREAGKSATLGELSRRGISVLTDDIVIVCDGSMFAGPRSIDLRAEAAEHGGGEPLGIVGNRPRWRLRPEPGEAQLPIAGLIELAWGEPARLEPLDAKARLQALVHSSAIPAGAATAVELLGLAALPAWRFVRAARIDELAACTDQLLVELSQA